MFWSLKVARIAGIGIFIHWTFLLLLAWIAFVHVAGGASLATLVEGMAFVLALFGCVLLHELGHALTAKTFGVQTRDITLLPIGGIARLERIPEIPWQEFLVAIAGPAVNVVIAGFLLPVLLIFGQAALQPVAILQVGGPFLAKLMWLNLGLAVFNMLPAFPMDGGRVLRALLATRMHRVEATRVASVVGKAMAILFGLGAIVSGQWTLLLIALFVYWGADTEAQAVEFKAQFQGLKAGDAMITRFVTLSEYDTVERAAHESSVSQQKDFPVTDGSKITGVLFHQDLLSAPASHEPNMRVRDLVRRDCPTVQLDEPLERAIDAMQTGNCSTLLVEQGGDLVGLLSDEHLTRWMQLHSSAEQSKA